MNRHPLIECHDVTLAYGREKVLEHVNLTIPRGILLPFIGPNGAGKTTLIKACLGLVPCQSGRIVCHFGPQPPAYVPQQKQIDPIYPLSVRDLVMMGLYPELGPWRHMNRQQEERLEGTLRRFGLESHAHKRFSELSGGLRQKTLLARAAVSLADLLVLDEPTAGLDAASEADLLELIQMLHAEKGKTILWVHHRLDQCTALVRQICRVEDGKAILEAMNEVSV
jgi:manganese/zinc/iron transport system ATP- binding protein